MPFKNKKADIENINENLNFQITDIDVSSIYCIKCVCVIRCKEQLLNHTLPIIQASGPILGQ
jgi:hypothetical protein